MAQQRGHTYVLFAHGRPDRPEALNEAYEVTKSRRGWKRFVLSAVLGPPLAVVVIVATGLMLIGPRVVEWIAD